LVQQQKANFDEDFREEEESFVVMKKGEGIPPAVEARVMIDVKMEDIKMA